MGGDVEAGEGAAAGCFGSGFFTAGVHAAAAACGLVSFACAATWLGSVPGESSFSHALHYLFVGALMQFSYNFSGLIREISIIVKGGGSSRMGPLRAAILLPVRSAIMYLAFGAGAVGATITTTGVSVPGYSLDTLIAAVVFIFAAFAINQMIFIIPHLAISAESVSSTIMAQPEGSRPSIDMVAWNRAMGFWNDHVKGVTAGMRPKADNLQKAAGKASPSKASPGFD